MADILLYGVIGDEFDGLDAKTLVLEISQAEGELNFRINCPGGNVMDGLAVYAALMRARAAGVKVTTYIDGIAASMASVVAMAGEEIVIAEDALMMIHNPSASAYGFSEELREAADQLDMLRDQCVAIYDRQTGLGADAIMTLLDAETWFTAQEALDRKFATSIAKASNATACNIELFGFRKAPESPRISAMAMLGKPRATPAAPPRPQETKMDLYKTVAALAAAIAKFQADGGTQAEIDKIVASARALNAQDSLPAAGALALALAAADPALPKGITPADAQARADNAVAAERTRTTAIRALGRKHKMDDAFVDELLGSATTVEQAQAKILDKLAEAGDDKQIGHTPIKITADGREKWLAGASAWMLTRAGVAPIVAKAAAQLKQTVDLDPGEFRGVSCVDLAREAVMNAGVRLATRDPKAIVGAAFTARSEMGQTTGDFTVLLENVMHKTLQAAFTITPDTWSRFCGTGTITDFRAHPRYLRGTFSALDALNESGEFRNKAMPDGARESITGATKGNIVALTRQAIINDDMGVFSSVAVDLGRAAKLTIEKDVYALLALNAGAGPVMGDGFNLFDATNHKNVAATPGAPAVSSFDAARVAMAQQMDLSGNEFLDIRPQSWLGPIGLGGAVRVIVGAPYDTEVASKFQVPNKVQSLVSDIIDTPRLSGPAWYMFADKEVAPAIEVAFLNGVQEPFLDSELGWRVDGTEWKVRLDYGVGALNWRCAYRNAGA